VKILGQDIRVGDVVKLVQKNRTNNNIMFESFCGIVIAKGSKKAIIRTNKNKKIVGSIAEMSRILSNA
jgi:hypothetical protein